MYALVVKFICMYWGICDYVYVLGECVCMYVYVCMYVCMYLCRLHY